MILEWRYSYSLHWFFGLFSRFLNIKKQNVLTFLNFSSHDKMLRSSMNVGVYTVHGPEHDSKLCKHLEMLE